jgi:hypothetical protein
VYRALEARSRWQESVSARISVSNRVGLRRAPAENPRSFHAVVDEPKKLLHLGEQLPHQPPLPPHRPYQRACLLTANPSAVNTELCAHRRCARPRPLVRCTEQQLSALECMGLGFNGRRWKRRTTVADTSRYFTREISPSDGVRHGTRFARPDIGTLLRRYCSERTRPGESSICVIPESNLSDLHPTSHRTVNSWRLCVPQRSPLP